MENELMISEDSWICKDNKLVNASYKLSVGELKLILAISSMVNPFDEQFKEYIISIKEFAKLLQIDLSTNKNFYSRVKRASSLLLSKRVTIHEKDGDFQTAWLAGIKYYDKKGKVAVSFHPRLKKYYLQLQEYTKYRLRNVTNLNSEYSLKLYEALKQYEKIGERIYTVDELKKFLSVEKQYDRFYDLKRRILNVTQKEISEKTDISFKFEEIKEGRSIKSVKFYIKPNLESCAAATEETAEDKKLLNQAIAEVKSIFDEKISLLDIKKLLCAAKGNIDIIREKYKMAQKSKNINNLTGWMISAITNDYKSKGKERIDSFNNYDQRTYDFKRLEEEFLQWENNY